MFDQGEEGICYLVAGINAFNNIPSILDQLFIDKEYSPNKTIYNFNVFINSYLKKQELDDKFLYYELGNNKLIYRGNQTFKYELFLKFIVKLFAELCKSKVGNNYNETFYAEKKLEYISKGGHASELYSCILGTSSYLYWAGNGQNEYINNLEKYINIPGNIIATSAYNDKEGHQYAVKNLIEYSGKNGEKKKFITLFNPWGKGEPEHEKKFFDFDKIQRETINFEYVYEFNKNYVNSGLFKMPLNLFGNWFKFLEICSPKYGFHYKVLNNNLKENQPHIYCFRNNINQKIEIELFLGELDNIRRIQNCIDTDIELSLSKLEESYNNINIIKVTNQKDSLFFVRKNAYILIDLQEGNYLINLKLIRNSYDYNLRIGGELEYLYEVTSNTLEIIEKLFNYNYYYFNNKIMNIKDKLIISKYILLEKTYHDLKVMSLAKKVHNILYNPYENDIEMKVENGLKNIVTTITDAFNNKIYTIKKNYENDNNSIYYTYKNVNDLMRLDAYKRMIDHEIEILKIGENLNDESKKVNVILQLPDDSKKTITLDNLIDKITGSELDKQQFYGSIRGYLITQYGIEFIKDGQKIESTDFFQKLVLEKIPAILKENDKNNLDFDLIRHPEKNEIINKNECDILFMIDATGSMSGYIKSAIQNCSNIIERLNLLYNYEKRFKYGAIFYRDPIDCKGRDKHSFFPMTSNKNEFQKWIKNITAEGGGDLAEDWNGAYNLALSQMNWSSERSNKIVVHIADSSAHGNEFNPPGSHDQHPEEGPKLIKTIEKVAKFGIKIIAFPIGDTSSLYSFKKFREIYKLNSGYSFFLFDTNIMDVEYFNNITEQTIKFIIDYS